MTTAIQSMDLVQRFYFSSGARSDIEEVMSRRVVWDITPGFPAAGTYRGLDAVLGDFLPRIGQVFSSMIARPQRFVADDLGHVAVLGVYTATVPDGRSVEARFTHLWTVEDGKIVRLDQTADTKVLHEILKD
ncbi:MAG: nuclear transport factor 2 family protein [Acidipropionibacterium sp.]|nr:nuclear transport factor 2 family protein [Acidipropionibacterium sp.]